MIKFSILYNFLLLFSFFSINSLLSRFIFCINKTNHNAVLCLTVIPLPYCPSGPKQHQFNVNKSINLAVLLLFFSSNIFINIIYLSCQVFE